MERFDTLTIEEATECLIDYRGKTPPKSESGVRLITAKVVKGGQIHDEPAEFIAADFYDEWMRRGLPQKFDVLLTTEAPLGEVAILRDDARVALAQRIILLRANPRLLDPVYLFYALQSDFGQGELKARASGTTVLGIKQSELRKVRVPVFPLPVQRRIAGILSAYDDLIENNQRRIAILERMARALYREWFVHFRYPGHEGVPLVDSPLGQIPQGWEVKAVKEILSRRAGGTVYRESGVKPEGIIPVLDQSTNELLGFHNNSPDHIASPDTPIAIFGDHTCKMQLIIEPFSIGPNVVPFTSNKESPTIYVFYAVNSLVQTQEYKRHWIALNAKEIIVAESKTAQLFASMIQPMQVEQAALRNANRNLRRTRDLLLPRLLSGQLDVGDVE